MQDEGKKYLRQGKKMLLGKLFLVSEIISVGEGNHSYSKTNQQQLATARFVFVCPSNPAICLST